MLDVHVILAYVLYILYDNPSRNFKFHIISLAHSINIIMFGNNDENKFFLAFDFLWVLRGHSVFSSPPHRPITADFEGLSIPDFIHYIYFIILILEKEPVFPFWMFSAKQGHYWYHFYNVFGMTRSLTEDWTRDLPHSKPALYH